MAGQVDMDATQDEPGPDHAAVLDPLTIEGAARQAFPTVTYGHGALIELCNANWHDMFSAPIEHLYIVDNLGGRREEWYEHRLTIDRYVLIEGNVTVALFDARRESPSLGTLELVELESASSGKPAALVIPAGVWHSFRINSERVLLMNAKTPGYNRANPDKYRMPMPNERCDFSWPE
jgi:dTDP-4-dehydrorhamnose 3,5-epimerase